MGAELVMLLFPSREEVYWDLAKQFAPKGGGSLDPDHPLDVVRDFAKANGIKYCEFADALRVETAMLGLQVHVIAPGSIRTDVSRNAVTADGSRRGVSDGAIEKGMDPDRAARLMLRAMARGEREIILAEGIERTIARVRRKSPNRLFDMMEQMMAAGYAERMKGQED